MTNPSTSNQKGIFCSSFLMSIFCQKCGCFTLPGGVCMCAYECEYAHEWWGIWQPESRFNNNWYIPGWFQTQFQLEAACDASRPQSEREKMREVRKNYKKKRTENEEGTEEEKGRGGVRWHLPGILSPCMLFDHLLSPSLFFHKIGGKMTSLIWPRQTSKPHKSPPTPLSDTSSLLWGTVCVYALYSEGVFFSQASGLTLGDVEMNPVPLPGLYSLRDIEAYHTL